ncbi:hypothetical protein GCM10008957_29810 [Deinococcus ruber]|uniref:Uncharacterized protein n=1 Tax=Deinococcus ruber TaxID=1848197 RepID=A0A918CAD1_9DEIO|nr:hypothetical protein GCM10008957_29810 [Deinococcus ruber]
MGKLAGIATLEGVGFKVHVAVLSVVKHSGIVKHTVLLAKKWVGLSEGGLTVGGRRAAVLLVLPV